MNHVIVVDYGSQYTRLITRRLRALGTFSLIVTPDELEAALDDAPAAVVLSGGPGSVYQSNLNRLPVRLLEGGPAVLGICYGMQLLASSLGGQVERSSVREYGKAVLSECSGRLFEGIEGEFVAWMSHGDSVSVPPPGFQITAASADTPVAAMESDDGRLFALQFHPEVMHTPKGQEVLERFVDLSGASRDWTPENVVSTLTNEVQESVGDDRVLLAISGGVDSSTLGLLLNRALGSQLFTVFVDHGLLRMGEAEEVERALRALGVNLTVVDASERFLEALEGVSDPEEKRKIVGREFIEVFTQQARHLQKEHGEIRFLAQGTLYPDVIESAGGHGAANIKSHHNVGGLPADLQFELLEPFRTLFKDEVREVAAMLGLPPALRDRHPFPGPGLAIRCLGEVTRERLEVLRRVDDIFVGALREFGLYDSTWQALAVLTPIRSVGVMGDDRTYANTVALRAVTSVDGMTADWTRFPDDFLATVSNRIVNSVSEVNRVVYDITSKPPGTIEWE
ncbi:MAG: glutamine-hydrolyzing GMP synthase [Trueperaceae bacterium]